MPTAIGHKQWAIAEGYIPGKSTKKAEQGRALEIPIVVQHTRLDSRQAELALISTMAFPIA